MKKFFKYLMLPALAAAAFSCTKNEEIVFEHEQQAFESREGKILLEVIMPQASTAAEEIYIVGAFNGYVFPEDMEEALPEYKDASYLMEQSTVNAKKWGIYLDPATFVDGKTLADGFTFISAQQGEERDALGNRVMHTLNIQPGQWANIYADKWAKYFQKDPGPQPLPTHDGVRVYIIDNTGWDAIALYQWGDENNLGGGWPGAQVSGELDYQGAHYKYFDYEDSIIGKTQNLIFNNNGGGTQLSDYAITFEDGVKDYFLEVNADGVKELGAPVVEENIPAHDGQVWVLIDDQTGWDAIALYQWGAENNLGGGWPGKAPEADKVTYKGIEWTVFAYETDAVVGKGQNLIFNNNGGGTQLADYALTFEEGVSDYLFVVTADGVTAFGEPAPEPDPTPDPTPDPEPEPEPDPTPAGKPSTIYVADNTGWDALYLYAWGDDNSAFGDWPGAAPAGQVTLCGEPYKTFDVVAENSGKNENLIFTNNAGVQTPNYNITLGNSFAVSVTADGTTAVENPTIRIYVINETGWDALYLYTWGDDQQYFGGWPGSVAGGKQTVNGVEYDYFELPAEGFAAGSALNFIFNNNAGTQYENDPGLKGNKATRDYYFRLSATGASVIE